MDHLPIPANSSGKVPRVPLYTFATCSTHGIANPATFFQSGGLKEIKAALADTSPAVERHRAHEKLQKFSFFGVLEAVMGEPLSTQQFIRDDGSWSKDATCPHPYMRYKKGDIESPWHYVERGGKLTLETRILATTIPEWMERISKENLSAAENNRRFTSAYTLLVGMSNVYNILFNSHHRPPDVMQNGTLAGLSRKTVQSEFPDCDFALSVHLLYTYLFYAIILAYKAPNLDSVQTPGFLGPDFFLMAQMREEGRCAAEINTLIQTVKEDLFTVWYLSLLDQPHPEKDHSACTVASCVAYRMQEHDYQTKHSNDGCECQYVYADHERLAQILRDSATSIPIVMPTEPRTKDSQPDGKLYVHLEPSKGPEGNRVSAYVAISHVWSDGLGNNKENAIPLCQFRRIRDLTASTGGPVPFWLDTLTFPLGPKDAYDLALQRMKQSYEEASLTLVLDNYLSTHKVQYTAASDAQSLLQSMADVTGCILVAPWNRRLWTYQEAHLTKRGQLCFQLLEGKISESSILQFCGNSASGARSTLERLLFMFIFMAFDSIRGRDWDGKWPMWEKLIMAKEALSFRETSHAEDEGLCLGNILGLDPKPLIAAVSRQRRMLELWKLVGMDRPQQNYHASILLWGEEQLDVEGYGWAPLSLMDKRPISEPPGYLNNKVLAHSSRGLHVRFDSILVSISWENNVFMNADPGMTGKQGFGVTLREKSTGHGDDRRIGRFFLDLVPGQAGERQRNAIARLTERDPVEIVILLVDATQLWVQPCFPVKLAIRSTHGGDQLSLLGRGLLGTLDKASTAVGQGVW
ncbi:hypothetical protein LY78DRAFT_742528 [Colletotrichum sublineola]|nr:hypothetical protein LY78DRAFT_742528 [Colletotrichum sublineola]